MPLDPAIYAPHPLHAPDRTYRETNCYTDVLIELLHSRGLEPIAGFGHLVRTDFEEDQFTFFKMPQGDLEMLFGVDIHEVQPVGCLPEQIRTQLDAGNSMLVELDSFYLPDTSATDYRRNHVKTSIAVSEIDPASETLRYFHNVGLHELSDEDFRGVFRLNGASPELLPPYLEIARFDMQRALRANELRSAAFDRLKYHLGRRPASNPFTRFGQQLGRDLPKLVNGDARAFHSYAFATVRMAGASFDLLRAHLDWMGQQQLARLTERMVTTCQTLSFRLARRRPFDAEPLVTSAAVAWEQTIAGLERLVS